MSKSEQRKAANLAAMVVEAEAVIDRLPEFAKNNAYVYFNQATKRHGFYFAPDDATAEKYAQRCGLAEQTNWLVVAVVPESARGMTERTHGGRRDGAGRPRLTDAPLLARTIRLTAEEWAMLRAEAQRHKLTTGRLIAATIRRLAEQEQER